MSRDPQIKREDSVKLPDGSIHEITSIQYVHNRYQLLGVSGWQYGIEQLTLTSPKSAYLYWLQQYEQQAKEISFWKSEAKQAKRDNAHWSCKYTAAEQRYQTQSNVIAELRQEMKVTQLAYEGLQEDCVTRGEYDSLLQKHTVKTKAHKSEKNRADKAEERESKYISDYTCAVSDRNLAEEREQNLKKMLEEILKVHSSENIRKYLGQHYYGEIQDTLTALYPLDKEDTNG